MTVILKPVSPQAWDARQVSGVIVGTAGSQVHFTDGTSLPTGTVPTTNAGAVTPNPTDWVLFSQDAYGSQEAGYGQADPTPSASVLVVPNAAFQATYQNV